MPEGIYQRRGSGGGHMVSLSIVVFPLLFISLLLSLLMPSASANGATTTVTVFAASSLTKAYNSLGASFQKAHPGVAIRFSFAASNTLASQIRSGAPADIFASADTESMNSVISDFPSPVDYVLNQVVVAVPKSSTINSVKGLNGSTKWLQCGHAVPCGIAADSALAAEGTVTSTPVSLESSASSALAKLLAGAVDAAIIYRTDVIANSSKIRAIDFADFHSALTQYQLGVSDRKETARNHWAQTFFRYLAGHSARKFLAASGFMLSQ